MDMLYKVNNVEYNFSKLPEMTDLEVLKLITKEAEILNYSEKEIVFENEIEAEIQKKKRKYKKKA